MKFFGGQISSQSPKKMEVSNSDSKARLFQLAAIIEQQTVHRPDLVQVAITFLQNLKTNLEKHRSGIVPTPSVQTNPAVESVPPVAAEPAADGFDPNLADFAYMNAGEFLCFDELDSTALAQVQNVPFLYHNNNEFQ